MKYKYSVTPQNQLSVKLPKSKNEIILPGKFAVTKDNRLFYLLNSPDKWKKEFNFPGKIKLTGKWRLNDNHDLELVLDKGKNQEEGDILTIKGDILSIDSGKFAFLVKSFDSSGLLHAHVLELSADYSSDGRNRIILLLRNSAGRLTLQGEWRVNKNLQISYEYQKYELVSKSRVKNTLTLEGYWQITGRNTLSYILKNAFFSELEVRVYLQTPNIYPQKDSIKYRIGAGLREGGRRGRILSFYGTWKFNRSLGLELELDYGRNGSYAMEFGARVAFTKADEVRFSLNNKENKPLGITLIFTHKLLKTLDSQAFLRLKSAGSDYGFRAGISIPF